MLEQQANLLKVYFRFLRAEKRVAMQARRTWRSENPRMIEVERERRRLGRELHTGVGQLLAAIRMQVELIGTQEAHLPPGVRKTMDRIAALADQAMREVRTLSHGLHPPVWQRLKLETAILEVWQLSGIPDRFESLLEIEHLPQEPALDIKILLYRALQEALSNLIQHSRAARVELSLRADAGRLIMRLEDDGIGFDAQRVSSEEASVASGIGLRSIREQASSLGAVLHVESGPNGTVFEVIAPFDASEARGN